METKGITCKIPLDLHNRISEEIRETESTISKFIEMVIMEHYEKGAVKVMEKGRTLAFQVSEELFQRVKEYLENYEEKLPPPPYPKGIRHQFDRTGAGRSGRRIRSRQSRPDEEAGQSV